MTVLIINKNLLNEYKINQSYVRLTDRLNKISVYVVQYHCSHVLNNLELRKYVRVILPSNIKFLIIFQKKQSKIFTGNEIGNLI